MGYHEVLFMGFVHPLMGFVHGIIRFNLINGKYDTLW